MDNYIFLTDEGHTFQPNSDDEISDTENLQVLGFSTGITADEAYRNLLNSCSYLKGTTFEKIFCYKLDKDYEQTRRNYNLKNKT